MSDLNSNELDLFVRDTSSYRPATFEETIHAARRVLCQRFRPGRSLRSPQLVEEYLRFALASKEYEVFCLIGLDARHRLLGMVELFRGTVDGAQVHPREIVKELLRMNAVSAIIAHNHPSQNCEPSAADETITKRIQEALATIDIRLVDHILGGLRSVTRDTISLIFQPFEQGIVIDIGR